MCDDPSTGSFMHSGALSGKVVKLDVQESSLYEEHEHTYQQSIPAGSRWRLLPSPRNCRQLCRRPNTTTCFVKQRKRKEGRREPSIQIDWRLRTCYPRCQANAAKAEPSLCEAVPSSKEALGAEHPNGLVAKPMLSRRT